MQVFAALHVDEIAYDQTTDITQPKLTGDFVRRFQVCLQNRFLYVAPTLVAASVDVDGHQGLSLVDHNVAAAFEPHLPMKGVVDLFLHAIGLENRRGAVVKADAIARPAGNVTNHVEHAVGRFAIVADDFIDLFR